MARSTTEMQTIIAEQQKKLYAEMLETGASNPIVASAIAEMRLRQQAIKQEQDSLLHINKEITEQLFADMSGDAFAKKVRQDSAQDKGYIEDFNKRLSTIPDLERNQIPWAVRTNKMALTTDGVIDGARTTIFGADETNIVRLAIGVLPRECTNEIDKFPVPGPGEFWGTAKVTYLSYALLAVNFSLCGKTIQEIPLTSAITHVSPLPVGIALNPNCRFSYSAETLAYKFSCFGYVHSGYSFGGYREDEKRLHYGKPFGPEDCSSWVAKTTKCPILFSTADQLCTYRATLPSHLQTSFIPPEWLSGKEAQDMVTRYDAVTSSDVQPGDIFLSRTFKRDLDPSTNLGAGGHTGIVLSKSESAVTILGFNRDMPNIDGFGIQEFPLYPVPTAENMKLIMFQRVRQQRAAIIPQAPDVSSIPGNSQSTLKL